MQAFFLKVYSQSCSMDQVRGNTVLCEVKVICGTTSLRVSAHNALKFIFMKLNPKNMKNVM